MTSPSPSPASSQPLTLFFLGSIIATLVSLAAWILAPIEARFVSTLTDNTAWVGATFAFGTLAFAVLALFIGRLSDRIGREKLILIGLALGIVYPLLYASAINVFTYMGVGFVWALSAVALGPVLAAYLQGLLQGNKKRGHYLSMMYASMSLSGAAGHFIGGLLAEHYGLTAPYYALAIIFALTLFVSMVIFRYSNAKSVPIEEASGGQLHTVPRSLFFGVTYIFTRPALIYYFILNSSFAVNYGIKIILWPLIVLSFTDSPAVMGTIFALTGVVAAITLMFSGALVDRFGAYIGADVAFLTLIIGGVLMGVTDSVLWFAIGALLFAIGEAFYGSAQGVLLIDFVENKYRGEILGVDRIFDNAFSALAMGGSGLLMLLLSAQFTWLLFVLYLALAYICAFVYRKIHRLSPLIEHS